MTHTTTDSSFIQSRYDAQGNRIVQKTPFDSTIFSYDVLNRLTTVTSINGNVTMYVYDHNGQQVREIGANDTVNYLIDYQLPYGQVVAEMDGSGNAIATYVYGLDRISMDRGGNTFTYMIDGQGSIRQLTNTSGDATDSYYYTAFGEELAKTGTTENKFRYVGEQWDANTGFYYNRARWYNPTQGRFVSVDPASGDPQGPTSLHRYLYANGNPISFKDPTGRFTLIAVMEAVAIYGILQAIAYPIADIFYSHGKRPDDDKYLTFIETALWWKHGKGKELNVDLNKIEFDIGASDFDSVGQSKSFNFASFRYYSNYNTALVYGRLHLTLVSTNMVVETDGGDTYDFDIPDPLNPDLVVRNVETVGGAVLHGPGQPFRINIAGIKAIGQ